MEDKDRFINLVTDYVKLPIEVISSKVRKRKYCEARQLLSYILLKYTNLVQQDIANIAGYKDHASVIRDRSLVPILLENKDYSRMYSKLLIEAKALASEIERKMRLLSISTAGEAGDICWFWNRDTVNRFPILGTYEKSFVYGNQLRYVCREFPEYDFGNCLYAGEKILPEVFQGRVTPPNLLLPLPYNLYYKVNTGLLCTA